MKILGNVFVFFIMYLLFMLPTYFLPYFGSNSSVLNTLGHATGYGFSLQFILHFFSCIFLILITWFRGILISKNWLVIFPVLASFFDLMPVLSIIPFMPTIMHLLTLIIGSIRSSNIKNESYVRDDRPNYSEYSASTSPIIKKKFCPNCGAFADDAFCEQCGTKQ